MRTLSLALALLAATSFPVRADDSVAALKAGSLILEKAAAIGLVAEKLYLSESAVRADYRFRNLTGADIETTLAFPMPDLVGGSALSVSLPDPSQDNFLRFEALIDGQPDAWQLEQHAILARNGQSGEVTDLLRSLGIPLVPTIQATEVALRRIPERRREGLIADGFLDRQVHKDGTISDVPLWTLKSKYWHRQVFPAGQEVAVHQSFVPSLGGRSSLSYGSPDLGASQRADYVDRFCTEPPFARAAQSLYRRASADGSRSFRVSEQYLSYLITPEDGWAGPIGTFTLTVDKGDPTTMVAFCGDNIRKVGPTTLEMVAKDYVPRHDIDVLLLRTARD